VIAFNTNQLNHFDYKNNSQQTKTKFDSQFTEKVKHLNNVNDHSSKNTYSLKIVHQPTSLITKKEANQTESTYFKQQFSLLATFAIKQYETFANIETQQKRYSLLSISEYA